MVLIIIPFHPSSTSSHISTSIIRISLKPAFPSSIPKMRAHTLFFALLSASVVVSAAPHELSDRQVLGPVVTWLASVFKLEVFKAPPLCDGSSSLKDANWVRTLEANGQKVSCLSIEFKSLCLARTYCHAANTEKSGPSLLLQRYKPQLLGPA
jgi:hypothetical protein